jgi:hypothetical protein
MKTNNRRPEIKIKNIKKAEVKPENGSRRGQQMAQFGFMRSPGIEHAFEVGDTVEVFCDHEKNGERLRGWLKGIVVQVDNKMVAVQFRTNVYLTDGWMVPDRILWYPLTSEHIRPLGTQKKLGSKEILEY